MNYINFSLKNFFLHKFIKKVKFGLFFNSYYYYIKQTTQISLEVCNY